MGNLLVNVSRLTCTVEKRFKYFWGGNYPYLGFSVVPNMLNGVANPEGHIWQLLHQQKSFI
jgi:hypothetical protein